jgi:hypothetical protein
VGILNLQSIGFTDPHQGVGSDCKQEDFVEAYKQYYLMVKSKFIVWKRDRQPPTWFVEAMKHEI